jgi:molybdopterin converting factor small subunit
MASPYGETAGGLGGRHTRPYARGVNADSVEVHLFAAARAAVGSAMLVAPSATLAAVLDGIERAHPSFAVVRPQCSFLVDGQAVHGDPATTSLPPGSRLDVLPPFAGG